METLHYCAALNKRFIVKGLFIFHFFPSDEKLCVTTVAQEKKTAVEWAEMNVKATDVVMNTLSLRRRRRAMEIDVAAESLIPLLLLRLVSSFSFCLQLTWVGGKSVRAHVGIYTKCTGCRCWSPGSLLKHARPEIRPAPVRPRASENGRHLMQAAELRTPERTESWCVQPAEPWPLSCGAAEHPMQVASTPFPLGTLISLREMHEQYDTARTNKLHSRLKP